MKEETPYSPDLDHKSIEKSSATGFNRLFKKSTYRKALTKPERNNLNSPENANHYYAQKVAESSNAKVLASSTGIDPLLNLSQNTNDINKNTIKRSHLLTADKFNRSDHMWIAFCYISSWWAPSFALKYFGMADKNRQLAWREKIGLLTIIACIGGLITFLTFGFNTTLCKPTKLLSITNKTIEDGQVFINGLVYRSKDFESFGISHDISGTDLSFLFQNVNGNCKDLLKPKYFSSEVESYFPCCIDKDIEKSSPCINSKTLRTKFYNLAPIGNVIYSWNELNNTNLVVYNGNVIDLELIKLLQISDNFILPSEFKILSERDFYGDDLSYLFSDYSRGQKIGRCLEDIAKVGTVDSETVGCVVSKTVISLIVILILVVIFLKFIVSIYYAWFVAPHQGVPKQKLQSNSATVDKSNKVSFLEEFPVSTMTIQQYLNQHKTKFVSSSLSESSQDSFIKKDDSSNKNNLQSEEYSGWFNDTLDPKWLNKNLLSQPKPDFMPYGYPLLHMICFVTCYSESQECVKKTVDSICASDYPDTHKLLVVVCDGLIKGSGNDKTTPELVLGLMSEFSVEPENVKPYSYVAVAYGSKRHNMAKVYSGFYKYSLEDNNSTSINQSTVKKVPIICIVKCGTESEQLVESKPGNRGKRDSQVILMSFLGKLFFDDRMSQLEYQILKNIWMVTGIMASFYEIVLTVDADTVVHPNSTKHMVAEMVKDPEIMGLCGETQIENKRESFTTLIQVFEYFISHHQTKAFESVFETVTCLPGCFSMYRIKSPKGKNGFWVPILANPDIIERYSDNLTNTLHKKNLLQLGEDRYLTSLLLKTFPRRKQIFVSKATCKTVVPNTFKVLLSQRRRWINSTIHNLLELLLVNELCGCFCFSMQFLILIELIGTFVLPLAITFTLYVIGFSIFSENTPVVPLILLGVILGQPLILIVLTGKNLSNILYMLIYEFALPIWNFVLPVYAFWKFDDFSWGETRAVLAQQKKESEVGVFDYSNIKMKSWKELAREEA